MSKPTFIAGGHSLSRLFGIKTRKDLDALGEAMLEVSKRDGKVFEIAYPLVGGKVTWKMVAETAKRNGIKKLVFCLFFPGDGSLGNPIGKAAEADLAIKTVRRVVSAAKVVRKHGVSVNIIDGPSHVCLGLDYSTITYALAKSRMIGYLQQVGGICKAAGLYLAVEPLRESEDRVVHSVIEMLKIVNEVNSPHIGIHYDYFHGIENGEEPIKTVLAAKDRIFHLHIHGPGRIAPGSDGDKTDWETFVNSALLKLTWSVVPIAVIPEPFGVATRADCPDLGRGLSEMPPLPQYLETAFTTLRRAGLSFTA